MANYVIITDSAADISAEQEKEWDTPIIKMSYLLNGTLYVNNPDHSELSVPEFYQILKNGAKASTSAINIGDFTDAFTPYLKDGKDVLYIGFSSGLSATYQNAINAISELREEFPDRKIEAVDSLCASFGQGLLVYLCSEQKKAGKTLDEVKAYAEQMRHKICHEFTVDDLGQLKRGGRISSAAAFFGSVLQIKPMLFVNEIGKLAAYDKVRSRRLSLAKLVDMIFAEISDDTSLPIFISHGDCEDDLHLVIAMLKEKLPKRKIITNYIGPVIGAHSGYKTLAIFCVGENRGDARVKE